MGLKNIKIEEGSFTANGNNYIITGKLSTERFKQKNMLEVEMSYGHDYDGIMKGLNKIFGCLNGNQIKPGDAAVHTYNMMQAVTFANEREDAILRYCALFVNREDEDIKIFDEKFQQEKIDDWHKEGIDMNDFFVLAANLVRNFKKDYLENIPNILRPKSSN